MKQFIIENHANIILSIFSVIVTFLSYYIYIKNKIQKSASDAITSAEELSKFGEEKMKIAVNQIFSIIPTVLKPVFPKSFVEQVLQEVFDKMKEFAEKRAKKDENNDR